MDTQQSINDHHTISDDSGFLALVDPDAYQPFVGEDWSLPQLWEHFKAEMRLYHLLIWGTGGEAVWRVWITASENRRGYRATTGSITATKGRLLLTNYDDLTMAAQFKDVVLPEPHQRPYLINVAPGTYLCRVVQMVAPEQQSAQPEAPHFIVELRATTKPERAWTTIPWAEEQ